MQERPNPPQMLADDSTEWKLNQLPLLRKPSATILGGFQSQSIKIHDRFGREVPMSDSPSGITTLNIGSRYTLSCEVTGKERRDCEEIEVQFWEFRGGIRSVPQRIGSSRVQVKAGSVAKAVCAARVSADDSGGHTVYGVKIVEGPFESLSPVDIDPDEITWTQTGEEGTTAMRATAPFIAYRGLGFEWTIGPDLCQSFSTEEVRITTSLTRQGTESSYPAEAFSFRTQDNAGAAITLLGTVPLECKPEDVIVVKVEIPNQPSAGFSERFMVGHEPPCSG